MSAPSGPLRLLLTAAGVLAAAGAACLAWAGLYEVRAFRLRRVEVPVLPAGSPRITVLHVSDLHLTPGKRARREWVSRLAGLQPDLVINTGDNLAHQQAVPTVLSALDGLLRRPGFFVWGSNDYFAPTFKNPVRYLTEPGRKGREHKVELPWPELKAEFERAGWTDLTSTRTRVDIKGVRIELRGCDDAHLDRDRYEEVAGPPERADVDLAVGVTHAPYLRVLDAMAADDLDLVLAGHTHGGQICVPFYGALVTNCDLDPARVKGLSRHTAGGRTSWLHVSAGLGTSPYAPIRFACPPEATLLTLVPR